MQVRKAVVTAAAPDQTRLPTQQLMDQHGVEQSALQLILRETLSAGVEEICMVIRPGEQDAMSEAAGDLVGNLTFAEQPSPLGYADALLRARTFVDDDPFLHLVGDHLYLSRAERSCARQLVQIASEFECSVSAVQATRENQLPYFGIVSGNRVARREGIFEVQQVYEKPTPTFAEQELVTPGLRSGHYLGFFGMHVLTGDIMAAIEKVTSDTRYERATLSDALHELLSRHKYMAFAVEGSRYNLGVPYGLLMAQFAIGLSGVDRDHLLTQLVDLLAQRPDAPRTSDDATPDESTGERSQ